MSQVIACIDGSAAADSVCEYAAWAASALKAPLMLLHVLDDDLYPTTPNLVGNLGLGSREHLLSELAELDARRNRLALEQGQATLEAARARLSAAGTPPPRLRQRHGNLLEAVKELEQDTRLLVIGKQGASHPGPQRIGDNVERVIRAAACPVLVGMGEFRAPASVMVAFDNAPTTRKGLGMIAESPLFRGVPCHLVTVNGAAGEADLASAVAFLEAGGHQVTAASLEGDVEAALHRYQQDHAIDMMVMGAYGHSRLREFLIGSTTERMLRHARVAHLVLR
ncbi:universal stress protein [Alloalcanivorax mobilis]|uniref:universal stress protein n=1 Tax=Alloalcanivorax mobilis TaxID=2019569 RepID=UPI000C756A43|nr:universal stress protein [Alloalcanivorax mobilis]